jgi:hypothetical protein
MLFNSIDFAIFLPIIFILYCFIANKNIKLQNFLIVASYLFYGWWDWRFLSLIAFITIVNYSIGPRKSGDIKQIYVNGNLVDTKLGWEPIESLEQAMKSDWDWQKK